MSVRRNAKSAAKEVQPDRIIQKAKVPFDHPPAPRKMPPSLMNGSTANTMMGALVTYADDAFSYSGLDARSHFHGDKYEYLLGFYVPPFQRPAVWTQAQQIRFLESVWLGLTVGTYVYNYCEEYDRTTQKFHHTYKWLIDGQQRLRAIKAYLNDEFAVFGHKWSDLDRREKRDFENSSFPSVRFNTSDEGLLREVYDRLNFGGTAHTEEQRATVQHDTQDATVLHEPEPSDAFWAIEDDDFFEDHIYGENLFDEP